MGRAGRVSLLSAWGAPPLWPGRDKWAVLRSTCAAPLRVGVLRVLLACRSFSLVRPPPSCVHAAVGRLLPVVAACCGSPQPLSQPRVVRCGVFAPLLICSSPPIACWFLAACWPGTSCCPLPLPPPCSSPVFSALAGCCCWPCPPPAGRFCVLARSFWLLRSSAPSPGSCSFLLHPSPAPCGLCSVGVACAPLGLCALSFWFVGSCGCCLLPAPPARPPRFVSDGCCRLAPCFPLFSLCLLVAACLFVSASSCHSPLLAFVSRVLSPRFLLFPPPRLVCCASCCSVLVRCAVVPGGAVCNSWCSVPRRVVLSFVCGVLACCVVSVIPRFVSSCGCALLRSPLFLLALCGVVGRSGVVSCWFVLCVLRCAVPPCGFMGCTVLCGVLWRCVLCRAVLLYVVLYPWALCLVALCRAVRVVSCCFVLACSSVCCAVSVGNVMHRVAS